MRPLRLPMAACIVASLFVAHLAPAQRVMSHMEALRTWHARGNHKEVIENAPKLLWDDIEQPEVLYLLGSSLEKSNRKPEAAAYLTLFLRTLDMKRGDPGNTANFRPAVERRLKAMGQDQATLDGQYKKAAASRKFESPEKVTDIWMSQVEGDLFNLHGLYAWKLTGGRKDAKPDWIHNTQGVMHRSGMKLADEVDGRKGVLFTIPLKEHGGKGLDEHHSKALERLGHSSRVIAKNPLGRKVLRIGTKAYGFPFILKVKDDNGKELLTKQIGTDNWEDLKLDLATAPKEVIVELIVPEGQKWSEGLWIDYIDFFEAEL
jgi:hypothetical protein